MTETPSGLWVPRRRWVAGLVVGWTALAATGIVIVDVVGVGAWIPARQGGATLWYVLYEEASPTEWVQATLLAAMAIYAGVGAARHAEQGGRDLARMLLLLAVAAGALLIEDATEVGQWFGRWARLLDAPGGSMADELARMPIFALVAAIPTYALLRYRAALRDEPEARAWLWAGWATYAVMAVTGEALQAVLPVYERVGAFLLDTVLRGALTPAGPLPPAFWAPVEVVFMDYLYEETLELVAAGLLLIGVLTLVGSPGSAPSAPAARAATGASDRVAT